MKSMSCEISTPQSVHEDGRRTLTEWWSGLAMRSLKIVEAKDNCVVGKHYHRNKTEVFYLLRGSGTLNGEVIHEGAVITVPPGEVHEFELQRGSILLGGATAVYDPTDEVKP